ncbi:hypothetical protein K2173_026283 [Erythroxylum novogranatense]|uniref:BRCT domain-containing protein n=1 Tax=Erythroxylum novogranatense TaxID=1862640 RepID=A0AAV8SBX8_9ROSI|nr:hypothetical protein K2173_026283 [Erythroxylum novogranatense]
MVWALSPADPLSGIVSLFSRNLGSKDKVHEFPNKETTLKDGDLVSFGAGNATYRFSFVPLLFFLYCAESFQVNDPLQEQISSIGAQITYHFNEDCTHVLVDELMPVKEDLLEAVVAKKPVVLKTWVEVLELLSAFSSVLKTRASH